MSLTPPPILVSQAIGIAQEASFGNGDAPDIWFHGISNDFRRRPDKRAMSGMVGGMSAYVYNSSGGSRVYEGMTKLNGPISIWTEFDDIGWMLAAMFGDPSTSGPTDTAAYTHVFTVPRAVPATTPTSLAVGSVGFNEDVRANGCLPMKWTLRGSPENVLISTFDMVGQGGANAETAGTVGTLSTAPWMEFYNAQLRWASAAGTATGSLTAQTGASSMRSFEVMFDNNYRVEQAAGDGQIGPREFTYRGIRPATLSVQRDNVNDQFFNDMYDGTPENWFNSVELKVNSGSRIITGASTTPYSLQVYSGAALLHGDPPGATADGVIPEDLRWTFADDLSNAIATITLINGTSAY